MTVQINWDEPGISWDESNIYWDFANLRPVTTPLPANPDTTYIKFTPSDSTNFQFQATLDGVVYTVIITWSLFGQRYYVNIYTTNGDVIVTLPMIGSPDFLNISLTAGYFTTQLVFRAKAQTFEVIG